ncbi:hypothetical protein CBOM_04054 [Ceraceosorus bombacis]|uniref:Molecular chaperones HSP70/HSC70, HSP70 superfamily n=1 Tax=Ceraceosorus bombacis TaxID=401625 RepID=A0A0P1BPF2_9BASI|nr:hypothetical protein CBOM_04054 [Ceraceosorus bombacis]
MATLQKAYKGPRKLVISFDFGTTYSGASACLLQPGSKPEVRPMLAWSSEARGEAKFPSVIYYARSNRAVRGYGDALNVEGQDLADALHDGEVETASLWKLKFKPDHIELQGIVDPADLVKLPTYKSATEATADFLRLAYRDLMDYIKSRKTMEGLALEQGVDIELVLSHPNGWESIQQTEMRKACELAGVTNVPQHPVNITFISEGEASLHYMASQIEEGDVTVIVDAGGGTIDISTYHHHKGLFVQVALPDCIYAGSATLDTAAKAIIDDLIEDRRIREHAYEKWVKVKHLLKNNAKDHSLSVYVNEDTTPPPATDHDGTLAYVKNGSLVLTKAAIRRIFSASIDKTVLSILEKIRYCMEKSKLRVNRVAFLGGLGDSQFYRSEVERRLRNARAHVSHEIVFCKPDQANEKAVASGAAQATAENLVELHLAPMHFGIEVKREFDAADPEHRARARAHHKYLDNVTGKFFIPGYFARLVSKGERGASNTGPSEDFSITTWTSDLACTADEVYAYRGHDCPEWLDEGDFEKVAKFSVDLAEYEFECTPKKNTQHERYFNWTYWLQFRLFGAEIAAVCSQGSKSADEI